MMKSLQNCTDLSTAAQSITDNLSNSMGNSSTKKDE